MAAAQLTTIILKPLLNCVSWPKTNNMKKTALLLFTAIGLLTANKHMYAQDEKKELPETLQRHEDRSVYFEKVYNEEGASKADLYQRAKQWVTTQLKTDDNNIAFDEQDHNYINTTVRIPLTGMEGISTEFKVSIMFKDGRVKLSCTNFTYINITQGHLIENELGTIKYGGANKKIYHSFDKSFEALLQSFENAMSKKGSDW